MNNYDIGSAVTVSAAFTANNVATDPTTVVLTITDPTGVITTVQTASLAHPSTGTFAYQVLGNVAGIWRYRFVASGNIIAAQDGDFNVTSATAGWTYSADQLANNQMMQVRAMIGDTYACDPQLLDAEVNFFISLRSSLYGAAAECCRSLAAKFSRSVTLSAGQSKATYSDMSKAYFQKANNFDVLAAMAGSGMPYAGGISLRDKLMQEQNIDRKTPEFALGMMDSSSPIPSVGGETELSSGAGGSAQSEAV